MLSRLRWSFLGLLPAFLSITRASAEENPLSTAHAHHEKTHVLVVTRVESAIEDLNKNTISVFGIRRELHCPDGAVIVESKCDPCVHPANEWVEHPEGEWIYEVSYANEEEHRAALAAAQHFGNYFELDPLPGVDKEGQTHLLFSLRGVKPPAPTPVAAKLRLTVGGAERAEALIPAGEHEIEIVAQTLKKNSSGALEPMPEAAVEFASPCARLLSASTGHVRVSLPPGTPRCSLTAIAHPGEIQAELSIGRQVQIEILFEGQAADEVVLEHSNWVDLTYSARALDKPIAIKPQWKGEHGSFEVHEQGRKVRFTLDDKFSEGSVLLLDDDSGASDILKVRRQSAK
jgi:hypothetical protein